MSRAFHRSAVMSGAGQEMDQIAHGHAVHLVHGEVEEWLEMARRARERAEEGARLVRRDLERLEAPRRRSRLWPIS